MVEAYLANGQSPYKGAARWTVECYPSITLEYNPNAGSILRNVCVINGRVN